MHLLTSRLLFFKRSWLMIRKALLSLARRDATRPINGLLSCICLFAIPSCPAAPAPSSSRSFNGVTAAFEIKNPVVKSGDNLTVGVVYHNTGNQTVKFHFFKTDENAELYVRGSRLRLVNIFQGEPQFSDVILKPGENARGEEVFNLKGWRNLNPGSYEIRFYYRLGLLFDKSLAETYRKKYPVEDDLVAWEDRTHSFTIIK